MRNPPMPMSLVSLKAWDTVVEFGFGPTTISLNPLMKSVKVPIDGPVHELVSPLLPSQKFALVISIHFKVGLTIVNPQPTVDPEAPVRLPLGVSVRVWANAGSA